MTSNNMYRVGDFVYFEVSASAPYQIRKIEELNKTPTGAVEAKVVCFYRRRDLSFNLIHLADKHQTELGIPEDTQPELLHQIRHRELFLSRQLETLPATHIRGKCTVTLHTESEPYHIYLSKEDTFFFQLVYDPLQKTLQADQGTIREGPHYQADVGPYQPAEKDPAYDKVFEELCWRPDNLLSSTEIDSYLLLIRSLATLGRVYYPPHMLRQPNLAMSAAAAARDSTHQFALDVLNSSNYNITLALQSVSPNRQPVLKLDEMEQWSASEGNLFEEALEKYGKCFYEIQNDFLPWKHPKSLVEFYYMWKTTDHYIQQKRMKATEAEHHLKQVYIPNYNKPNPVVLYPQQTQTNCPVNSIPSGCEGCPKLTSTQWYALGPSTSPLKVCTDCWNYWKRYGDLKAASVLDKVSESNPSTSLSTHFTDPNLTNTVKSSNFRILNDSRIRSSPSSNLLDHSKRSNDVSALNNYTANSKARSGANFNFVASMLLRIARRLCTSTNPRRQARQPFKRLSILSNLHKDVFPLISRLDIVEVQNLVDRIRNTNLPDKNNPRGSIICNLVLRLLINKPNNNDTSVTKSSNKLLEAVEKSSPATANESVLDLAINGVSVANRTNNLKRRASSPKTGESTEFSLKKSHTLNSNPEDGHISVVVGPKRRFSIGSGADEVSTLMYLASPVIKRSRRRLFSIAELRRLGRRPWFETNLSELSRNGFHNGPSTKSMKLANSATSDNSLTLPVADSLCADLSTVVPVNPPTSSSSSSNSRPIKPQ